MFHMEHQKTLQFFCSTWNIRSEIKDITIIEAASQKANNQNNIIVNLHHVSKI